MAAAPPPAATVTVAGDKETIAAFRRYARGVANGSSDMRAAAGRTAAGLAGRVQSALTSDGDPRSPILALTVRVKRDTVPAVTVGGSRRLFSAGTQTNIIPAGRVLFGTEFGAHTRIGGYRSHTGRVGYAIFPAIRAAEDVTIREYRQELNGLARQWGLGG
jgi:hypothetical protein